jgi:Uncharacterized flagellar protein FlaG
MALDLSSIHANSPIQYEAVKRLQQPAPEKRAAPENAPTELATLVQNLQRESEGLNRRLSFSMNEKLGQVVVKVIDADTDKVVREIPAAEMQQCSERIREAIGLLVDKSA